jgi:hypothetical protein
MHRIFENFVEFAEIDFVLFQKTKLDELANKFHLNAIGFLKFGNLGFIKLVLNQTREELGQTGQFLVVLKSGFELTK